MNATPKINKYISKNLGTISARDHTTYCKIQSDSSADISLKKRGEDAFFKLDSLNHQRIIKKFSSQLHELRVPYDKALELSKQVFINTYNFGVF